MGVFKNKIYSLSQYYGKKWQIDFDYFVKNGFWMVFRQSIDILIGLVVFSFFAHLLTKESFGYYQYVLSVFSIVSIVSIPGLNNSIFRAVSRGYDGEYKSAVSKSFVWSLLGIPFLLLIGYYFFLFGDSKLGIILMVSSIFFPFFYAPNTWNYFLQGKEDFKRVSVYGCIQSSINALATIAAIYVSKGDALIVTITYLFSYSAINIFFYCKSLSFLKNNKNSGEVLKYGWFLTKINFVTFTSENIDKVIIGTVLSPDLLAVYAVVSVFSFKLRMVAKSIFSIFFPRMSKDKFTVANMFENRKFFMFMVSGGVVFLGILYFFVVEKASRIFFGEQYLDFYYYGKYFVFSIMMYVPLSFFNWYVQAKKMTHAISRINIIFFFSKIIVLIVGVKIWGIEGAIWAYNINIFLLLLLHAVEIYKKDPLAEANNKEVAI